MPQPKEQSIGALWLKNSETMGQWFSGVLELNGEKVNVVVFPNNYKDSDKKPDFRIYKSKKQEGVPRESVQAAPDEEVPLDARTEPGIIITEPERDIPF